MLDLLDWKRRIFALYEHVRAADDPEDAWRLWRTTRDELFRSHPQSPLPAEARAAFRGLDYFPYDPAARVTAVLEDVAAGPRPVETSGQEPIVFRQLARASFELRDRPLALDVYWLERYGGGVFLPFRDRTSGLESFGGGRYVLDTVKGADLGSDGGRLVLDFNFSYNPSCSYDPGWACPLAPPANTLDVGVEAGERHSG